MAGYELIVDVSRTLLELLRNNMTPEPISNEELIGLCSPNNPGNYILGLELYNIEEKKDMGGRNSINLRPGMQKDPPTPLLLYYMLTVYSKTEMGNSTADEQRILGRVIQLLNDNGKLRGDILQGSLKKSDARMEVTHINLSLDEKVKIWSLYNQTYKLSVYYCIGPVYLESDNIRETVPVTEFRVNIKGGNNA